VKLSPEQIDRFWRDGFLMLDEISPPEEVARTQETLNRLFRERAGWEKGAQFDLIGAEADGRATALPQLLTPVQFAPELAETQQRANALAIASQLLGAPAEYWFEHAILKPAGHGAATPWHQDDAHRYDPGTDYDQLSIWMPLQEATEANGCMQYIAGSHRGEVLPHRAANNDPRASALECMGGFDPATAVKCPLLAGGAVVHHSRTLHHAAVNHSTVPRLAYILGFRANVRPNPDFKGHTWNVGKLTAASERAQMWARRGGPLGRLGRATVRGCREFTRRARRAVGRIVRG
jgi:ectoine hydroxylase-related dioxygenase (phytanoyl-CoA dioxygenase family)